VVLDWQIEPNEDVMENPSNNRERADDRPRLSTSRAGKWHRWRELAQEELDDIDPGDPSKEYERAKAAAWLQHSEREYDKVAAVYDQF